MASAQQPLSLHSLYQILTWGVSSNQQQIQLASQQLQELQKQPGFHALLQRIIGDFSLAFDVRWLAAIQLKNGIDRYWRKTAINAITKDEKVTIRSRCVQVGTREPDQRLALQNALFVAKIVRTDYPHDWPDAITLVLEAIEESTQPDSREIQMPRSLLLMLAIVKELSAARLIRTRKSMYGVAPDILRVVGDIYMQLVVSWQEFLRQGNRDAVEAMVSMERSLLCLRLLRRLIVSCFENPGREPGIHDFWSTVTGHFEFLIGSLQQHGDALQPQMRSVLEQHALQIGKLHLGMIETHPTVFPQLPSAIAIARAYWGILKQFGSTFGAQATQPLQLTPGNDSDGEETPFLEKLSLRGLLLLRGCVKMVYNPTPTLKYQTAEDKQERNDSKESMRQDLLSEALVLEMMETLVTKFFVFRPSDLRRWQEEPDEWERQEEGEGENWKYSVRVCAEKLFLDLILNHKTLLVQPLLDVFSKVATTENTDVLLKDSIYGAIGLSAAVLVGTLDFNSFLTGTLIPEIQLKREGYNILRRRAAIMLGQWVAPASGNLDTGLVYQVFQFLLDKTDPLNDLVVRITAGRQLKNAIDPYSHPGPSLDPYISPILERLLALVDEIELVETKMAVLSTIQTLIQLMGENVTVHADQVMNRLPTIWDAANDEYLMKQNILGLISELLRAMKSSSIKYHSLILPLIASALDLENEDRLNLLDDAVDLWSAVLCQTPESSPELLSLLPHLYPLFELADDNLKRALEIANSYILLASQTVINDHAVPLLQAFKALLDQSLKRDARIAVCHIVEQLLIVAFSIAGKEGVEHMATIADNTNLAQSLLSGLMEAYRAHQDPSPHTPKTDIDGKVETRYWCIISRLVVGSPGVLLGLIQSWMAKGGPADGISTMLQLITELFSHYESLGDPNSSKIVALASAALFGHNDQTVLREIGNRLQEFLSLWTAAVHEIAFDGNDSLIWGEEALLPPDGWDQSPEDKRKQALDYTEPVRRVNVRDAIKSAIIAFTQNVGGEAGFNEYMQNVDKDVLEQFQALRMFG